MPIHRARLYYDQNTGAGFNTWLNTWLINMEPWAERPNEVPSLLDPSEVEPHYSGDLTFEWGDEWSEDKAIILDNLDGYLSSYANWYRIGYHVCDHNETARNECGWDERRQGGSVPSWVEDLTPE